MTTAEPVTVAPGTDHPDNPVERTAPRERTPWLLGLFCLVIGLLPGTSVPAGPLKSNGSPMVVIALTFFGLSLIGFALIRRTGATRAVRPVVLMILLYFVLDLVVYGVGATHHDGDLVEGNKTRALVWLCASVGVVLYGATRVETTRQRTIVLGCLATGLTFACFVAVLQNSTGIDLHLLFQPPGFAVNLADSGRGAAEVAVRFGSRRALGTATSPIELSVMAAAAVPLTIHFARYASTRRMRWIAGLACGLALFAIPASVSRSGALALVAALLVSMWALRLRQVGAGVVAGALALLVLKVAFPGNTEAMLNAIVSAHEDASITERAADWTRVSHTFHDHPVFGLGLGGSPPAVYGFLDNEWAQAVVQGGILSVAAMIVLMSTGTLGISAALRSATTPRERDQAYTMGAMFVGILVSSFTFDLFGFRQAAFILFLLVGLLWSNFTISLPSLPERRPRVGARSATPDRRRRASSVLGLSLVAVLGCASCADPAPAKQFDSAEQKFWSNDKVPTVFDDPDDRSIEIGTAFTTASDGFIVAARFYQGPHNTGADSATLWASDGTKLATAAIPNGPDPSGWREIRFDEPVPVKADGTYVVSYRASHGHYSTDADTFSRGRTVKNGWLEALGGVFTYGNGFPDQFSNETNYYVDVVFRPSGPTLRKVDGGEHYYDSFTNSFPTKPDFFPLGVWFTSTRLPEELASDRSVGINSYVMLTADSNVQLIAASGMHAITDAPNSYSAGQLLTDEADEWAGAGNASWTGKTPSDSKTPPDPVCIPEDAKCGYTVMMQLRGQVPPGVLAYANYSKGLTFWLTRDAAKRFVNDFQNLVSVDNYWFTDPDICQAGEGGALKNHGEADLAPSECNLAANYGLTTRYVRSLVQPRAAMPVWNFVELGHPSDAEGSTITGPQVRAAVWSSLINGARGIIYFVHNFGGPCLTVNLLRDRCGDAIRADLTAVNAQIGRLAPVLNAPFVDGYARSDAPVDLAAKRYDGSNYVLVGATRNEPSDATINLSCGDADSVEVIDENRTLPVTNRSFRDAFADGNAVHLYKIKGTKGCGLD